MGSLLLERRAQHPEASHALAQAMQALDERRRIERCDRRSIGLDSGPVNIGRVRHRGEGGAERIVSP